MRVDLASSSPLSYRSAAILPSAARPWTASKAIAAFAPNMAGRAGALRGAGALGAEPRDDGHRLLRLARRSADRVRRRAGRLFVVRNVAALVPPFESDPGYHGTSAALEFGVKVLEVARLVVLGHGQCGGIKAMAYGPPPQARDFIASWVAIGKPAVAAAGDAPEDGSSGSRPRWCACRSPTS